MFRDEIEIRFRFTIKTNIRENDPPKHITLLKYKILI